MNPVTTVENETAPSSMLRCEGKPEANVRQRTDGAQQHRRHESDQRLDLALDLGFAQRPAQHPGDHAALERDGRGCEQQGVHVAVIGHQQQDRAQRHALQRGGLDQTPDPARPQHEQVQQQHGDQDQVDRREPQHWIPFFMPA
jgi:hypothetical protein